jgi:hypothetical protein
MEAACSSKMFGIINQTRLTKLTVQLVRGRQSANNGPEGCEGEVQLRIQKGEIRFGE